MKILCVSDIHFNLKKTKRDLVPADVLVIAGDSLLHGNEREYEIFNNWVRKLDYPLKLVIAGNHDFIFQDPQYRELDGCVFLHDSEYVHNGVKFYGSPWTPRFGPFAFMGNRGTLCEYWEQIPMDTDVLITHGPPFGVLDYCNGGRVGDEELIQYVEKIQPKVHIFGHIHPSNGIIERNGIKYVNAAASNDLNVYANKPKIIDIF